MDIFEDMFVDLYAIIRHCWIWCCRFRHRRGYGVHSPFAYNLIKTVFYERGNYYAYPRLNNLRRCTPKNRRENSAKVDKMLFRLANYARAERMWVCGTCTELTCSHLEAARPNAVLRHFADEEELSLALMRSKDIPDWIYFGRNVPFGKVMPMLSQQIGNHALVVLANIYADKQRLSSWKAARNDERCNVSFDLYDVGILFYDPAYQKQNYIVNF
jgi:hypothetical protein